jgi:hypothetical protein
MESLLLSWLNRNDYQIKPFKSQNCVDVDQKSELIQSFDYIAGNQWRFKNQHRYSS